MTERRNEQGRELADLLQLGATWAAVSRILEHGLGDTGISLPPALALLQVAAAPEPLLLSRLALRLVQEAQSVTSLMDRLERAGWAQRMHDLPDRRTIRIELTEAGVGKADEVGRRLPTAAEQVLGSVEGSVRDGLAAGLTVLYAACRVQEGVRLRAMPGIEAKEGEHRG